MFKTRIEFLDRLNKIAKENDHKTTFLLPKGYVKYDTAVGEALTAHTTHSMYAGIKLGESKCK